MYRSVLFKPGACLPQAGARLVSYNCFCPVCAWFLLSASVRFCLSTPVEILWNNFVTICNTCLDLIPIKLCSSNSKQPWINIQIKCLSRRKQHAYNQAHNTNESQHWTRYYNLKMECQQECRIAYTKYVIQSSGPK